GNVSLYTIRPQEPHSSSTLDTQASFSTSVAPYSSACVFRCGASSQYTQRRQLFGRCSRLSSVTPTTRRDTRDLPDLLTRPARPRQAVRDCSTRNTGAMTEDRPM